ncbi:MAG: hypothetical protein WCM93_11640 [Bacteroidota bacterium]
MNTTDLRKARISLTVFALLIGGHLLAAETWKKVESESGITIYERWVKVSNDLTVRERKGEMIIKGTMSSVINTLNDPSKTKLWMENVSDAYLVNKESDMVWSSYTYFSLPWPFENRDMVSVSKLNYCDPASVTIEMISKENSLPLKKNVKRMANYKATWKIADLGNGRVYISLSAMSSTAPEYPRFIMDPVVRGAFLHNLIKLKVVLAYN